MFEDETQPQGPGEAEAWEWAIRFLRDRIAGEDPVMEEYLGHVVSESGRAHFRKLVADGDLVEQLLPAASRQGRMVGGRYLLGQRVGAGGMGEVFAAHDMKMDRRVAVKVLFDERQTGARHHDRFEREWRLLARLNHPNIVKVYEADRDGEVEYVVMDLVEGRSLAEVLAAVREGASGQAAGDDAPVAAPHDGELLRRVLSGGDAACADTLVDDASWFRSVARIFLEIVKTVAAAHDSGVVHRDLKPKNVVLRPNGSPVVLDFGLAGRTDGQIGTVTEELYGTVQYVAPEQVRSGRVGSDPRSDIYQLGLLLYELLTLQSAYRGASTTEIVEKVSLGEVTRPRSLRRSVPVELEAICMLALNPRPAHRYPTAWALAQDVEHYLQGRIPAAARGYGLRKAVRRARYLVRRHRTVLLSGAALVLGVLLAAYYIGTGSEAVNVTAFLFRDGLTSPIEIGQKLRAGDTLGVGVKSDRPAVVYALSVFGEDGSPPSYMRPVPFEDAQWFLTLQAGQQVPPKALVAIDDSNPAIRFEGLWVLVSDARRPDVERWLADLETDVSDVLTGVPHEEAIQMAVALGRAAKGAPLSDEQRREYERYRVLETPDPRTGLPFENIEVEKFLYAVEGRGN